MHRAPRYRRQPLRSFWSACTHWHTNCRGGLPHKQDTSRPPDMGTDTECIPRAAVSVLVLVCMHSDVVAFQAFPPRVRCHRDDKLGGSTRALRRYVFHRCHGTGDSEQIHHLTGLARRVRIPALKPTGVSMEVGTQTPSLHAIREDPSGPALIEREYIWNKVNA